MPSPTWPKLTAALRSATTTTSQKAYILHEIPKAKTQIYISRSRSPYLNLSIEHHLLKKSPPDSTILFLYTNENSIVIGRNQNPWVEINHNAVHRSRVHSSIQKPWIVRRRSGGGTVWHDEGNLNYSVICPTANFDRDKHAQMVVGALQSLAVQRVRVNERHDIVMDSPSSEVPLKISGSAYKLTRLRSLHHGTCLLNSPHLDSVGLFLRSPLKKYIKARGVDSVRSPITNVKVESGRVQEAVTKAFQEMYGDVRVAMVGEESIEVPEIAEGVKELSSPEWTYGQTPQFDFSFPTPLSHDDTKPQNDSLSQTYSEMPPKPHNLTFAARNGSITSAELYRTTPNSEEVPNVSHPCDEKTIPMTELLGTNLHDLISWESTLKKYRPSEEPSHTSIPLPKHRRIVRIQQHLSEMSYCLDHHFGLDHITKSRIETDTEKRDES